MGWEMLLYAVILEVIAYAITAANTPKPQAPAIGQLDIPVASEGTEISVIFGTVLVKDSNVIWYGDPSTSPIKTSGGKK